MPPSSVGSRMIWKTKGEDDEDARVGVACGRERALDRCRRSPSAQETQNRQAARLDGQHRQRLLPPSYESRRQCKSCVPSHHISFGTRVRRLLNEHSDDLAEHAAGEAVIGGAGRKPVSWAAAGVCAAYTCASS